ncbi:MAG: HNH endonuclease [Magnetococcales bacterium]|nr:HNH endonuclease [Magnetococcales bacterium]
MIPTIATVVDHIVPIKDGGQKFDPNNFRSLCVSCHNRRTMQDRHKLTGMG